jgi:3-deoxy-D-arabino-heptulosonate 7-phosphate (DAHP) synthase class II
MSLPKYFQGPRESVDYFVDVVNDTISTTLWSLDPAAGATLGAPSSSQTRTICRISGLAVGTTYNLFCDITLASGQTRTARCQITGGYSPT